MAPAVLYDGMQFPESPRWRDGRVWVCDWAAEELLAIGLDGASELIAKVPSFPFCIDWLPDGRLLINAARLQAVLTLGESGALDTYAALGHLTPMPPGNEIVVHPSGNAYVNGAGFNLMSGEAPRPGMIALVRPDGSAVQVAGEIEFPNGMAVTPDGATLLCADSYAHTLIAFTIAGDGTLGDRRTWADLGDGVPDGICLAADGSAWYADVPNRRCVRVAEGGAELDRIELDRGAFSCALADDEATLFVAAREWHGTDFAAGAGTGQLLAIAL